MHILAEPPVEKRVRETTKVPKHPQRKTETQTGKERQTHAQTHTHTHTPIHQHTYTHIHTDTHTLVRVNDLPSGLYLAFFCLDLGGVVVGVTALMQGVVATLSLPCWIQQIHTNTKQPLFSCCCEPTPSHTAWLSLFSLFSNSAVAATWPIVETTNRPLYALRRLLNRVRGASQPDRCTCVV